MPASASTEADGSLIDEVMMISGSASLPAFLLPLMLASASLPATAPQASPPPRCPVGAQTDLAWRSVIVANSLATADSRAPSIPIQAGLSVNLLPTPSISYVRAPEQRGGSVSQGGLLAVSIPRNGLYRVSLDSAAWVDLVHNGKAETSVGHGHGEACSGVRKYVDFQLAPGRYWLQIAGAGREQIRLNLAPVE